MNGGETCAAAAAPPRFRIGDLAVDRVTLAGALDLIEALVSARHGGNVFTPNVDHVVLARRNQEFRTAYQEADLCLADGMPLVWASRWLHEPLPERVAGADLVLPLVARAALRGWRLYLLGGAPGVPEEAARRLREQFPAAIIVGTDAPRIDVTGGGDDSAAALQRLEAAGADVVLVSLGAPKQEIWMHRHRAELRGAVAIGVGAALDFIAGRVRRAPLWVSRAGLEWLWRLSREPRRLWRRYLLDDPRFAAILVAEARRRSAR